MPLRTVKRFLVLCACLAVGYFLVGPHLESSFDTYLNNKIQEHIDDLALHSSPPTSPMPI